MAQPQSYFSDDEFNAIFDAPATPATQALVGHPPEYFSDADFDKAFSDDPKIRADIENNYDYLAPVKALGAYYSNAFGLGSAQTVRSLRGRDALIGLANYDDIKDDASLARLQELEKQKGALDEEIDRYGLGWLKWAGAGVQAAPFMGRMQQEAFVTAAAGAGIGGAAGLAGGPFAEVTVPGGAVAGATWGYRTGLFSSSSSLMAGDMYLELRDAGVEDGNAKIGAVAAGGLMGLVETLQLKGLNQAGRAAFEAQFKSGAGKAALNHWFGEYVKEVGVQVTEEELQQVIDLATRHAFGAIDYTKSPDIWREELTQTLAEAFKASTVLVGGSQVSGTLVGKAAAKVGVMEIDPTVDIRTQVTGQIVGGKGGTVSLKDAFTIMANQESVQPTQQEVQQASVAEVGRTLDELVQPLFDEQGNLKPEARTEAQALLEDLQKQIENARPQAEDALKSDLPLEVTGRITELQSQTDQITTELQGLEKQFNAQDATNKQAETLKSDIAALQNEQKVYAAQIAQLNADVKTKEKAGESTDNIWKTLDKIGTKQEATVNKIEKAKAALAKLKVKPTDQILQKIQRLSDTQKSNLDDVELLQSGLFTPADIKNMDVKVKARQITKLKTDAFKQTVKAFDRGVREGRKASKSEMAFAQQRAVDLIKNSNLSAADKSKFLAAVKNIKTAEQFVKKAPELQQRIADLEEKQAVRDAKARLSDVFKRVRLYKSQFPKGKFTAEIQKAITEFAEYNKNPDKREAAIQAYQDALAKGEEITDQMLDAYNLAQFADLKGKDSIEINRIAAEFESLVKSGKFLSTKEMEKQRAETAERQQKAYDSIQGSDPYKNRDELPTWGNAVKKFKRNFFATGETFKGLMEMLSQNDKQKSLVGMFDEAAVRENYFRMEERWQKRVSTRMMEALDTILPGKTRKQKIKALERKLGQDTDKKVWGDYTNADGQVEEMVATRGELRKLWMEFQAGKVDDTIKESHRQGNKYTYKGDAAAGMSTEELLESTLSKEDIAIASAQFEIYEDIYQNLLNPYWRKQYKTDLPKAEMYSPIARQDFDIGDSKSLLEHFMAEGGVKPSSAIKRVKSYKPIALMDDMSVLSRHLEKIVRFVAYDEFDRHTRSVFNNGKIRTLIKNKYGTDVLGFVDRHRHDITTGRALFADNAWRFMDTFRRKISTAYIGGKLGAIPKQATAMLTALAKVGPIEFTFALAETTLNPVGTYKTMAQSATVRRLIQANDRDIIDVLARRKAKGAHNIVDTFLNIFLAPIRVGVGYGVLVSSKAVYNQEMKKSKNQSAAIDVANRFVTDTQQAGFIENLSAVERSGPLGRLLTMFGGDPLQSARQIIRANRDILNNPKDFNAYVKALRTYAVFHLAVPLAFQVAANAVDSDPEGEYDDWKLLRTAMFGPWLQIPIIGDTLNFGLVQLQNKLFATDEFAFEPSSPALAVLVSSAKGGVAAYETFTDDGEKWYDALYNLSKATPLLPSALGGGLPWPAFVGLLKPFKPEKKKKKSGIKFSGG